MQLPNFALKVTFRDFRLFFAIAGTPLV